MSAVKVLIEYGAAWRGDWSDFDGRTLRDDISVLVPYLDGTEEWPGDAEVRNRLGICNNGGGHWCGSWGSCDQSCDCPCTHG